MHPHQCRSTVHVITWTTEQSIQQVPLDDQQPQRRDADIEQALGRDCCH